jgi:hypothetical protein
MRGPRSRLGELHSARWRVNSTVLCICALSLLALRLLVSAEHMTRRSRMAIGAARRWSRGKLSRARRRRARLNLLAWLRQRDVWPQSSPFDRPPLAA